ncbi:MAG TPA: PEGA domain-containing protein [Kofleriaceae bacterium]|nr:PEGA domain-containing protein [Kofleriaceae bacterium]
MRQLSVAGAIAIALAGSAHAEGVGVIAAGGDRGDASKAMAGAIADARPARIVDDAVGEARAAVVAGAVPVATLERFRHVREQIDEAWRAFLRVQVDFAASRLAAARTAAESLVSLPGGASVYADASLRLGAVLGYLGRAADSQAILALALALDPERPITIAEFSPDVVSAVDAVRAQTRPTRAVRITSEPAGAAISVDGKELGRAPLHADLAVGQHVVVGRAAQYQARAMAVAIGDGANELSVELERDIGWTRLAQGATIGASDADAQELVDAAVRYADLDEVVLVAAAEQRGGPTLLVQRCAGLPARCTAVIEVGYAEHSGIGAAAREAWQAARVADLRYPPSVFGDPRATGKKGDGRCKLCRSPILWGGVGVAAVVATVAIIAIVSSSRPPPVVGVDPTQF